MSKEDDVLPLPQSRVSKGPTAEELKACSAQAAWLAANINWKVLRRLAYRHTRDPTIGRELVQELHNDMLLWSLEKLLTLDKPEAFAYTLMSNRLIDWTRKASRTSPLSEDSLQIADQAPSLEEQLSTRGQALALMAKLPLKYAEPLIYCKAYEYTAEETAEILHLTVDVVKKRMRKALDQLEIMAAAAPEDSLFDRLRSFIKRKERRHDK